MFLEGYIDWVDVLNVIDCCVFIGVKFSVVGLVGVWVEVNMCEDLFDGMCNCEMFGIFGFCMKVWLFVGEYSDDILDVVDLFD